MKILANHRLNVRVLGFEATSGVCLRFCSVSKDEFSFLKINRKFSGKSDAALFKFPKLNEQREKCLLFFRNSVWKDEETFREKYCLRILLFFKGRRFGPSFSGREREALDKNALRKYLRFMMAYLENSLVEDVTQINSKFFIFLYFLTRYSNNLNRNVDSIIRRRIVLRNLFFIYFFFEGRLRYFFNLNKFNYFITERHGSFNLNRRLVKIFFPKGLFLVLYSPFKSSYSFSSTNLLLSHKKRFFSRIISVNLLVKRSLKKSRQRNFSLRDSIKVSRSLQKSELRKFFRRSLFDKTFLNLVISKRMKLGVKNNKNLKSSWLDFHKRKRVIPFGSRTSDSKLILKDVSSFFSITGRTKKLFFFRNLKLFFRRRFIFSSFLVLKLSSLRSKTKEKFVLVRRLMQLLLVYNGFLKSSMKALTFNLVGISSKWNFMKILRRNFVLQKLLVTRIQNVMLSKHFSFLGMRADGGFYGQSTHIELETGPSTSNSSASETSDVEKLVAKNKIGDGSWIENSAFFCYKLRSFRRGLSSTLFSRLYFSNLYYMPIFKSLTSVFLTYFSKFSVVFRNFFIPHKFSFLLNFVVISRSLTCSDLTKLLTIYFEFLLHIYSFNFLKKRSNFINFLEARDASKVFSLCVHYPIAKVFPAFAFREFDFKLVGFFDFLILSFKNYFSGLMLDKLMVEVLDRKPLLHALRRIRRTPTQLLLIHRRNLANIEDLKLSVISAVRSGVSHLQDDKVYNNLLRAKSLLQKRKSDFEFLKQSYLRNRSTKYHKKRFSGLSVLLFSAKNKFIKQLKRFLKLRRFSKAFFRRFLSKRERRRFMRRFTVHLLFAIKFIKEKRLKNSYYKYNLRSMRLSKFHKYSTPYFLKLKIKRFVSFDNLRKKILCRFSFATASSTIGSSIRRFVGFFFDTSSLRIVVNNYSVVFFVGGFYTNLISSSVRFNDFFLLSTWLVSLKNLYCVPVLDVPFFLRYWTPLKDYVFILNFLFKKGFLFFSQILFRIFVEIQALIAFFQELKLFCFVLADSKVKIKTSSNNILLDASRSKVSFSRRFYSSKISASLKLTLPISSNKVRIKKLKLFFPSAAFIKISPIFSCLGVSKPVVTKTRSVFSLSFLRQYMCLIYFGFLTYGKSDILTRGFQIDCSFLESFPRIFSIFSFRSLFRSALISLTHFFNRLVSLSSRIGFFTFFYTILSMGYSLFKRNQRKLAKVKQLTQTKEQKALNKKLRLGKLSSQGSFKESKYFNKKKKRPKKFYMYAHILYKKLKHPGLKKKSTNRLRRLVNRQRGLSKIVVRLRASKSRKKSRDLKRTLNIGILKKQSHFRTKFLKTTNHFLNLLNFKNLDKEVPEVASSSSLRNYFFRQFRISRRFLYKRFQFLNQKDGFEKFVSRSHSFNDKLKIRWIMPSMSNGLFVSPKKYKDLILQSETFFGVFFASSILSGSFLESKFNAATQFLGLKDFATFFKGLSRLRVHRGYNMFLNSKITNVFFVFNNYNSQLKRFSYFFSTLTLQQYLVLISKIVNQSTLLNVFLLTAHKFLLRVIASLDICVLLDLSLFCDSIEVSFFDCLSLESVNLLSLVFNGFFELNHLANVVQDWLEFFYFPSNLCLSYDFLEDFFPESSFALLDSGFLYCFDEFFWVQDSKNTVDTGEFISNVIIAEKSVIESKFSFSKLMQFYLFIREYSILRNFGFFYVPLDVLLLRFSRNFIDSMVNLGYSRVLKDKVLGCWFIRLEQSFFFVVGGALFAFLDKCLSFKQTFQKHFFNFLHFLNAFFLDVLSNIKVFERVYYAVSQFFSTYFFGSKKFNNNFSVGFKLNILRFILNKFKFYSNQYYHDLFLKRNSSLKILSLEADVKNMKIKRYSDFSGQLSINQVVDFGDSKSITGVSMNSKFAGRFGFVKLSNNFFESFKMENLDHSFSHKFVSRFRLLWLKKFLARRYFIYGNSFLTFVKKTEKKKNLSKYARRKGRRSSYFNFTGRTLVSDKFYRIPYSFSSRFPFQFLDIIRYRRFRNLHLFSSKNKFSTQHSGKLKNFFDSSSSYFSANFRNRYRKRRRLVFQKRHLVLKSRFHPILRHKVLFGFFLSPRFLNFKSLTGKDFFFMDNLRFKLRRKLAFFFRMNRFLEFLIKLLYKVRTYIFSYSKNSRLVNKLKVLDSFLSNKYLYSLYVLYKRVKSRTRRFLLKLVSFFKKKRKRITNVYKRRKKSVNFVLRRLRFLFFYNFFGLYFLKFFVLRYLFVEDFVRYRFQFMNRFLWFRTVHLNSILSTPKIFIIITKMRNNFFITGIDLYGRTLYKTSPGMVNFTGSDRMSKYAWFAAAVDFCEGFLEFFRYYLRGRKRRRFSLFRVMQNRKILNKELALQKRLGDAFDYKRSLRYKKRLSKKRAKQRIRLRRFFIISKGISNFNLRIFLKGMFSIRYTVSKFFSGAVNYPMRSFSLCRIKKVRRI